MQGFSQLTVGRAKGEAMNSSRGINLPLLKLQLLLRWSYIRSEQFIDGISPGGSLETELLVNGKAVKVKNNSKKTPLLDRHQQLLVKVNDFGICWQVTVSLVLITCRFSVIVLLLSNVCYHLQCRILLCMSVLLHSLSFFFPTTPPGLGEGGST